MTLFEKIIKTTALTKAWENLDKSNKDSSGLDKITIDDFSKNDSIRIKAISNALLSGKFKFDATKGVLIPKTNGMPRPLRIPNIKDRVVIKSLALALEEIFNDKLYPNRNCSFAYQKGLGVQSAIQSVVKFYDEGFKFVLKGDIVDFFGNVDRAIMLQEKVFPKLPDRSIDKMLEDALTQKVGNINSYEKDKQVYFQSSEKGIPQGNALSPLFSNIYLIDFDNMLRAKGYNLIRYADDFIIMCENENACLDAYNLCKSELQKLGLELHPLGNKSKIINLEKESLTFLSVTYNGKILYPSTENFSRLKNKLHTICHDNTIKLNEILKKIINCQEGWIASFIFTDLSRYFQNLDSSINRELYLRLDKEGWTFKIKSLKKNRKIFHSKGRSPYELSEEQRLFTGIPISKELYDSKKNKSSSIKSKK